MASTFPIAECGFRRARQQLADLTRDTTRGVHDDADHGAIGGDARPLPQRQLMLKTGGASLYGRSRRPQCRMQRSARRAGSNPRHYSGPRSNPPTNPEHAALMTSRLAGPVGRRCPALMKCLLDGT